MRVSPMTHQPGRAEYEQALSRLRKAVAVATSELSEFDHLSRPTFEHMARTFDEFFHPAQRFMTFCRIPELAPKSDEEEP